jgi:hypothetical protein
LPEEQARFGNRRFYRRITDKQWQDADRQAIQDTAFHLKADENGLSVFDADLATPRAALENQLDIWRGIAADAGRLEKDRKWAGRKLEQCGDSVEGLVAAGFGIAEVTETLFRRYGFVPSLEIEANGHLEILGTKEAFEEQSLEIIDDPDCRILSPEECLEE